MGERRYINKSFVTLFYENVEEGNLSYVSSINGYNFMKQNKDISYKIYDDIDIYKTINSYEQVFDNIEAVNYYKDIYNQIIFEYKIN